VSPFFRVILGSVKPAMVGAIDAICSMGSPGDRATPGGQTVECIATVEVVKLGDGKRYPFPGRDPLSGRADPDQRPAPVELAQVTQFWVENHVEIRT
jgi:hypothetical protein